MTYRLMMNDTNIDLPLTFADDDVAIAALSLIFTEASYSFDAPTDEVHVYNSAIQDADDDDDEGYDVCGALVVSYQVE